MRRCAASLLALGLALLMLAAGAVSASQLMFKVSDAEQEYLNALHAPESLPLAQALQQVFLELDVNGDGELSSEELQRHEDEGTLLAAERTLASAFDLDNSGSLSQAELTLAPHTLQMLELHAGVDVGYVQLVPQQRARAMHTPQSAMAAAAFDGFSSPTPLRRLKSRRSALQSESEWGVDQSLSEVASWAREEPKMDGAAMGMGMDAAFAPADAAAAPAPAAPSSAPGVVTAPRTPGQGRNTRSKAGSKRGVSPLPVSIFGVPSVADEECVMCQYFVQRAQNDIAGRLESAPGTSAAEPPSGGAGLQGAAAAAQQALRVRNTNSQLQKRPGGRGIVRVVTEDILTRLCVVDRMPQLFAPYCSAFAESNTLNAVRKALFFNIPTAEVCSQAALCRDDSYLNTNAAVHATKTSLFLNGQRGICGMLGGARDRPNSREGILLNAVCAAHGVVFGETLPK